jgi:hypothetical protein
MPVWSCLPFPLDRCFQKLHIRNLREKLEGNSYFLTYSLTLFLKVHSGQLWYLVFAYQQYIVSNLCKAKVLLHTLILKSLV